MCTMIPYDFGVGGSIIGVVSLQTLELQGHVYGQMMSYKPNMVSQ